MEKSLHLFFLEKAPPTCLLFSLIMTCHQILCKLTNSTRLIISFLLVFVLREWGMVVVVYTWDFLLVYTETCFHLNTPEKLRLMKFSNLFPDLFLLYYSAELILEMLEEFYLFVYVAANHQCRDEEHFPFQQILLEKQTKDELLTYSCHRELWLHSSYYFLSAILISELLLLAKLPFSNS